MPSKSSAATCQGLIQKEKVHIEDAQISILANKIAKHRRPNIIITESKQTAHKIYFYFLGIMLLFLMMLI